MDEREGATNVLFVVLDTVRKDHLTVYGYDRPTTPSLEAFAEEAAVYEGAVAQAPWTLPSHATMFTGLYPGQHGASQERPYLEGTTTLAETLSAAGYDTACFSSNAWITPYTRLTDGFGSQDNFFQALPGDFLSNPLAGVWKRMTDSDTFRGVADTLVDWGNRVHEYMVSSGRDDSKTPQVIDQTTDFIDDADGPFFAFINLMDAHLPYHPPEEYRDQFAPGVDPNDVCQNSKEYNSGARDIDDEEWETIRGLYDAELRHIDSELGRLFEWLRTEGHWENTTVIVTADHGELHGEHDLYGHEFGLYEPIVNVPLLVKHPALEPERIDRQLELLDLYHTVLDVTGVDPREIEGVDAVDAPEPLAEGEESAPDRTEEAVAANGEGEPEAASPGATWPGGPDEEYAVAFDPGRSLLGDEHRSFAGGEFGFVEYTRPIVELNQLENKASRAGIELDRQSRFYSRMRAIRRPDAKYVRNERITDEFYRLDEDPDETDDRFGEGDPGEAELLAALSTFEERVGGPWKDGDEDPGTDGEEALEDMDEQTRERLRDLGYID